MTSDGGLRKNLEMCPISWPEIWRTPFHSIFWCETPSKVLISYAWHLTLTKSWELSKEYFKGISIIDFKIIDWLNKHNSRNRIFLITSNKRLNIFLFLLSVSSARCYTTWKFDIFIALVPKNVKYLDDAWTVLDTPALNG